MATVTRTIRPEGLTREADLAGVIDRYVEVGTDEIVLHIMDDVRTESLLTVQRRGDRQALEGARRAPPGGRTLRQ